MLGIYRYKINYCCCALIRWLDDNLIKHYKQVFFCALGALGILTSNLIYCRQM
jgi:hypothetical protein